LNLGSLSRVVVFAAIGSVILIALFTTFFAELWPDHVPYILPIFVALFWFVVLASNKKLRDGCRMVIERYSVRLRGRKFLWFGLISNFTMLAVSLTLISISVQNPQIPYIPQLAIISIIIYFVTTVIVIYGLIKTYGKWGLLIILLAIIAAALRFLIR